MMPSRPPFPESVRRPRTRRRRSGAVVPAVLVLLVLTTLLPRWTVRSVRLPGNTPATLQRNLTSLEGFPLLWLDLGWIRHQVEAWPGMKDVEIRRGLDGTVDVRWDVCTVAGSVRTGVGWHGLCEDGTAGPRLDEPVAPVIEPPRGDVATVRRVLEAGDRLERLGLGPVTRLRIVLPGEIEAWTESGSRTVRVLAALEGSPSETAARRIVSPRPGVTFLDVAAPDRVVVGPEKEVGS